MAKVWKDLSEISFAEVPSNLKSISREMKTIPKFEKSYSRKIYQKNEYSIYKVDSGFIVHNTKKEFSRGYTHLGNYHMCKLLIDCSIRNKFPRTRNTYLLKSLIRISNNKDFKIKICDLINRNIEK